MARGVLGRTTCSVNGCDAIVKAWGLCRPHGRRLKANDPAAFERLRMARAPIVGTCVVGGCVSRTRARGYCARHYDLWLSNGVPEKVQHRRVCGVDDCTEWVHGLGYCTFHYTRFKAYGDPVAVTVKEARSPTCSIDGCDRSNDSSGFCSKHYQSVVHAPKAKAKRDAERALLPPEAFYPNGHLRRPLKPWEPLFEGLVDRDGPMPLWRPDLGPCWIWKGTIQTSGHGQFRRHGQLTQAHRQAWELWVGPASDDKVMDHLCRTAACVNVVNGHLEEVTQPENMRRALECARCKFFQSCPKCAGDLSGVVPLPGDSRRFSDWRPGVKCDDVEAYFWSHLDMDGPVQPLLAPGPCWDWLGAINNDGYGTLPRSKDKASHRLSVRLSGRDPKGMDIDHLCGRRSCQAWSHLEVVTKAENSRRRHVCRRCKILESCPACGFVIIGLGSAEEAMLAASM